VIFFLRFLFIGVVGSMLGVTTWASLHQSLGDFARSATFREPWVIATLADAYWAFVAFYVWVAWKEQSLAARVLWFVAIILLGNMAMAAYMLVQLFAVPTGGPIDDVFIRRQPGKPLLPGVLTALAVGIYLLA
jgi:hypothetical protein